MTFVKQLGIDYMQTLDQRRSEFDIWETHNLYFSIAVVFLQFHESTTRITSDINLIIDVVKVGTIFLHFSL